MQKPFLFLFVVSCLPSCNLPPTNNTEIATTQPSTPPPFSDIVITDSADLGKHVGQIVTLIGKQSRTYTPYVLSVPVEGAYSLSDNIVVVRGLLSSYDTTEDDVIAFHARNIGLSTEPLPVVGTHYSITEPKTGEIPKTYLWNTGINNPVGSGVSTESLNVDTHSASTADPTRLHAIHFHREQLGVGKQAPGIVFCVRSRPSDPEGGTEVIVIADESLSKMGLNSLIDLPENPQRKEILLRTSGPQRFAAFTRFDIDGDGIDEVLLTGKGGAGGWTEVTVFKIKHQAVNVIYHGGSKYGLAILDIDDDGKYEIANAGIVWQIRKNIIKAKQYDIYRLTGEKFQKTSTMKAEKLEQLFAERKEQIAIPRQAIETGNGVALRIYKIKKT